MLVLLLLIQDDDDGQDEGDGNDEDVKMVLHMVMEHFHRLKENAEKHSQFQSAQGEEDPSPDWAHSQVEAH